MAFYQFSQEELDKVLAFVNNESNEILGSDSAQRFVNLAAAFHSKVLRAYGVTRGKLHSAERTISRQRVRLDGRVADGTFVELDFDSVDVALCLVYLLNEQNLYYSRERIQYLLYEAYSRWLADHSERLTTEHPVAQEWGPHFWHISKICGKTTPHVTIEHFRKVAAKNAGVAEFLRNVVTKYGSWTDAELKDAFVRSTPYVNAKNAGNGKWGREVKDADIFAWKK